MTRHEAAKFCRSELDRFGLTQWGVRLNQHADSRYLGLCAHADKVIILSAHHIDIHPEPDVINTIRHEVAHAVVGPGHAHDDVWSTKAREIGCDNTRPCSTLTLDPTIIDAIRSGADVEVTFEEHVTREPKYKITRLQDKCPYCGKVARTESEKLVENTDDVRPNLKFIKLECGHTIIKKIPKGTPFHKFQMGGDANCPHIWDKNKCVSCGRFRPFEFQIEGMQFLEMGLAVNNGAACCDEMGLGKTIQAEGVIFFHSELWPCLWVVKSGLKWQFAKSIINWMGDVHVPQVIERSTDILIPGLKHYIIGYDMLVPKVRKLKSGKDSTQGFDISRFAARGIKCIVLDECQQIKNVDSTRTQMVRRVIKDTGAKVIPLSGTPWKNRGSELFPMLNMIDPYKFNSEEGFKNRWVRYEWNGQYRKEGGIKNPELFKEHIKDLCIRRERKEVMKELPEVNRTKMYVRMGEAEEGAYDEAVQAFMDWYNEQAGEISGMQILAAMTKMRHLIGLAKIPATLDYIDEFVEDTDRKLVIFTHHKDVEQIIFSELTDRYAKDMPVLRIVAEMNGMQRFEAQELFNNSPRALMVASTLAAGEGLNLQTCADCILHERQWNPANEEQAEGRFIRIGQTSTFVNATYAHCEGLSTIDPHFDAIVERKRLQFHQVMNTGEAPKWSEESVARELAEAIISGHIRKMRNKK